MLHCSVHMCGCVLIGTLETVDYWSTSELIFQSERNDLPVGSEITRKKNAAEPGTLRARTWNVSSVKSCRFDGGGEKMRLS